jgi:hypothetical protein
VYYSHAHVSEAGSARAWTTPTRLSDRAVSQGAFGAPEAIAVSGDTLSVALTTTDGDVLYRRSEDGGDTWLPAVTVAESTGGSKPDDPRIAAQGARVFVTWSEFTSPQGWPPSGIFYAYSSDGGAIWSRPVRVAGANRALLTVIPGQAGAVYRMWNTIAALGQHVLQFSPDGGRRGPHPTAFFPD